MVLVIKYLLASAGDVRDVGLIPRSGRSLGGGHCNPHQCSCLGNPTDRETCQAPGHRVAKSWTQLKRLSMHALFCLLWGCNAKMTILQVWKQSLHTRHWICWCLDLRLSSFPKCKKKMFAVSVPYSMVFYHSSSSWPGWSHISRHHKQPPNWVEIGPKMFAIDGQLVSSLGTALHTSTLIITPHSSNHILEVNGNKFNIN